MTRGTLQPRRPPKADLMNLNNNKKKIISLFTSLNSLQLRHIIKRHRVGGGAAEPFRRKAIINYTLIGFLFVTEAIGAASAAGLLEQTIIKSKTGHISLVMHRLGT